MVAALQHAIVDLNAETALRDLDEDGAPRVRSGGDGRRIVAGESARLESPRAVKSPLRLWVRDGAVDELHRHRSFANCRGASLFGSRADVAG